MLYRNSIFNNDFMATISVLSYYKTEDVLIINLLVHRTNLQGKKGQESVVEKNYATDLWERSPDNIFLKTNRLKENKIKTAQRMY